MLRENTDKDWEYFGKTQPYLSVWGDKKYSLENLDEKTLNEFYQDGKKYVDFVFETIKTNLDPEFNPHKALDFGCGTGRLLIPLSERCESCTGIDISEGMLKETEKIAHQKGIKNISLVKSDDHLTNLDGEYDFINSYIVFQHIPIKRGEQILKDLLTHLAEGGVGVLHFTYNATRIRKFRNKVIVRNPVVRVFKNALKKRQLNYPFMQMNFYDLNKIFLILQQNNCHKLFVRFTDHGEYGVMLFFQKQRLVTLDSRDRVIKS